VSVYAIGGMWVSGANGGLRLDWSLDPDTQMIHSYNYRRAGYIQGAHISVLVTSIQLVS
jgi:hypothetical protein